MKDQLTKEEIQKSVTIGREMKKKMESCFSHDKMLLVYKRSPCKLVSVRSSWRCYCSQRKGVPSISLLT